MFQVDADEFQIILDNGYTLTFTPCDESGKLHFQQDGFDENHPRPQTHLKMNVSRNGTNVNHIVMDANELALQIKSFAEKPALTDTK